MNHKACKYVDYQEVVLQEPTDDVPHGSMPRHLRLVLQGALTQSCAPGDILHVSGVFLPRAYQHAPTIGSSLLHDTYFEAFQVTPIRKTMLDTETVHTKINDMRSVHKDEL